MQYIYKNIRKKKGKGENESNNQGSNRSLKGK